MRGVREILPKAVTIYSKQWNTHHHKIPLFGYRQTDKGTPPGVECNTDLYHVT